jgi:hypothetical protein
MIRHPKNSISGGIMIRSAKKQRGVSMLGILFIATAIILVAVGALKVIPAYLEFGSVKAAVSAAKASGAKTVVEVQKAFDKNAEVNSLSVISGKDLEVTKEGNDLVIVAKYDKKIPLFANVSVLIEFNANSKDL